MTTVRFAAAALAVFLAGSPMPVRAASPAPDRLSPLQIASIDGIARTAIAARATPSVVVGVARHGRLVFAKAYGYRNLDDKVPADVNTVYGIGSNTKQFTAAAILMLRDAGSLDVDAPVARYLPGLPHAAEVTVRNLLTHTAGYAEYTELDEIDRLSNRRASNLEILQTVAARPLGFVPGTKWQYSNTGYVALAAIVEAVSGLSYPEFLRKRIFEPLGMTRTRYGDESAIEDDRATGYSRFALGRQTHEEHLDYSWFSGAGAIESTVADLAKWNAAIDRGTLLSAASREMMHTSMKLAGGEDTQYGFGLLLRTLPSGKHVVLHGGDTTGFGSQDARFVEDDVDVIVLTNQEPASYNAITNAIYAAVTGTPAPLSTSLPLPSGPNPAPRGPALQPGAPGPSSAPSPSATLPPYATREGDALARAWLRDAMSGHVDLAKLRPSFRATFLAPHAYEALRALSRFGTPRLTLASVDRRPPTSSYAYLMQTTRRTLLYEFALDDDGRIAGADVWDPDPLLPDAEPLR